MRRDIVHERFSLPGSPPENLPETICLDVVFRGGFPLCRDDWAGPDLPSLTRHDILMLQRLECRRIVGPSARVSIDVHEAVALIRVEGVKGCVDWDLLVVYPESVTLRVGVGEEACL